MASSEFEVVVVGGGAAGIAAATRLVAAGIDTLIVEARPRLGGRSWTITVGPAFPADLGCGWLHSADRNPWREIAELQGRTIDPTLPPWTRPSAPIGFPPFDQAAFMVALRSFHGRLEAVSEEEPDRAAMDFLEPHARWNDLLDAVSTFFSGAELNRLSVRDFARYKDSGVNWRIVEGYGAVIAAQGADLPVRLGCPVRRIDRKGRRLKVETTDGVIVADAAIVTLPTSLLAEATSLFSPSLPEKAEAAAGLPLGLADKLFLSLSEPEEFEGDSFLFGRTDRAGTGRYLFRPFGRPMIEAYFGGELAADLEAGGAGAFLDFAVSELVGALGSDFVSRLKPLQIHCWGADPYARGSYSYALPEKADCRAALAAPVDDRLFFAGEACSRSDFSTAHGAYLTGFTAAEQAIAAIRKRRVVG